jgi:hypothetical protein
MDRYNITVEPGEWEFIFEILESDSPGENLGICKQFLGPFSGT